MNTRMKEIDYILSRLESNIRRHVKETVLNEQEDLSQDMKIKILEKLDTLLEDEPPNLLDYIKEPE
ncbi:hypothetical protein [Bacillus sp. 1006-3]|uniref:hypothetical protein n=1 Tax=Bacillus sp. 1006-3 TaxID=2922309 RepID=UPI001F0E9982|nr:hypothetical protein [Bacillus sp. 1006-3]MCH4866819.1 hypothetical protein [Bacillus sp. 1006-3]